MYDIAAEIDVTNKKESSKEMDGKKVVGESFE